MNNDTYKSIIKSVTYKNPTPNDYIPEITAKKIIYKPIKRSISQNNFYIQNNKNKVDDTKLNYYDILAKSTNDITDLNSRINKNPITPSFFYKTYNAPKHTTKTRVIIQEPYFNKIRQATNESYIKPNNNEVIHSNRTLSANNSQIYSTNYHKQNDNNNNRKIKTTSPKITTKKSFDYTNTDNLLNYYNSYNLHKKNANTPNNLRIITLPSTSIENRNYIQPIIFEDPIKNFNSIQTKSIIIEESKNSIPLDTFTIPNTTTTYTEISPKQITNYGFFSKNKPKIEISPALNNYNTIQNSLTNYADFSNISNDIYLSKVTNKNMLKNPIIPPFDTNPIPTVTINHPYETNCIKHIYKRKQKPKIQINTNFLNDYNNISSNYSNYYSDDPPDNFNPEEFDIIKLIGKGEIAKIYSVIWKKNGKKYAMKKLFSFNKEYEYNERQQAHIIRNFYNSTNCDGIIKVFGESMSPDKNTQYILMELGDYDWNNEIENRLKIANYYSENELLSILTQLTKTCALLEKNKISHRDIKPDNIFIVNGKYKLGDFSDSKIISEGRSQQSVRGTEMFMSPLVYKAYRKNNLVIHDSYKSDVYSLGICMLYAASFDLTAAIDIKNIIDSQSTKKFIARNLSMRYSKNFIEILSRILQYDESNRPNFNDLEYMLMNKESNCIIN